MHIKQFVFICVIVLFLFACVNESGNVADHASAQQAVATFLINTNSTYFWATAENGTVCWAGTNATYTIQSAFDDVASGGIVQLGIGQFPVLGIYITNTASQGSIRLTGAGEYQSTLELEADAPGQTSQNGGTYPEGFYAVVFVEGVNDNTPINIEIDNIGINGNCANQTKNIAGIVVRGGMPFEIHDNYIVNCGGHGIACIPPEWFVVKEIYHNTIYYTNMYGATPAVPPEPVENTLSGIYCYDVDSNVFDNTVGWSGWTGSISGMNFTGVGITVFVTDNVQENWMWGDRYGILAVDAQQLMITNNFVDGNKQAGIFLWDTHLALVSNNEIRPTFNLVGNAEAGIIIAGNSSYNTISNNMIWSWCDATHIFNTTFGIEEKDQADYNIIQDNDVIQNQTTLVSGEVVNSVGNILIPYYTIGKHTILIDNIPSAAAPSTPAPSTPTARAPTRRISTSSSAKASSKTFSLVYRTPIIELVVILAMIILAMLFVIIKLSARAATRS